MSKQQEIPEVDIVVDEQAGVIREVPQQVRKTRSKKGHETRVNIGIYVILVLMSLIWLIPFIFLVFQSFRSYKPGIDPQVGGMAPYVLPTTWSLDSYAYLFEGSDFFPWMGKSLIVVLAGALIQTIFFALLRKIENGRKLIPLRIAGALLGPALMVIYCAISGELQFSGSLPLILISSILCAVLCWIFAQIYLKNDLLLAKLPGMQPQTIDELMKKVLALFGELAFCLLLLRFVLVPMTPSEYLRWYGNTLIIALFTAALQTIIVLSVSYAFSRIRFKGRKLMMNIILVLGMFPGFLTMITLYFLLKQLGLTKDGAVPGLILIYIASSGMGYYISKGFFDTIPKSLDESARIDGATRFQVFKKIIMPLAKPIVIYTVLMAFMAPWGDFVFASLIAFKSKANYNVAVGLYQWINTNDYQGYFTRFCAGGVLVALPITALFLALQKYYVEGVTGGAVKG